MFGFVSAGTGRAAGSGACELSEQPMVIREVIAAMSSGVRGLFSVMRNFSLTAAGGQA